MRAAIPSPWHAVSVAAVARLGDGPPRKGQVTIVPLTRLVEARRWTTERPAAGLDETLDS